jgi:clan AA aspartic protease
MVKPLERTLPPQFQETDSASHGENKVGLVYADIELISGDDLALHRRGHINDTEIRRMTVNAMVDSGALMLVINEEIKAQLGLQKVDTSSAQLADGSIIKVEVVGPVEVRFANRRATVDALVLPDDAEPLFGAIPMESMDVLIDPRQRRLVVNPDHPDQAQHSLKLVSPLYGVNLN